MVDAYALVKALHIIAVISWMAALLYLPRLFVYHAALSPGAETGETFKLMERRLLRAIATPAMIVVWLSGLSLAFWPGYEWMTTGAGWLHAKLVLVLLLSGLHGLFSRAVKNFAVDANARSPRTWRILNEAVTICMVVIVILVVLKPF